MQPLMEMVCYGFVYSLSTLCLAVVYTVYGNGMLPLMKWYVTALGNLSKLPNALCNRLWKWYVTALSSTCLQFV